MAQLVERSPSTQNVAGSNPARGSSFFLSRKKGVVFGRSCLLCLVSLNEFTCIPVHVQCTHILVVCKDMLYTCTCTYTFLPPSLPPVLPPSLPPSPPQSCRVVALCHHECPGPGEGEGQEMLHWLRPAQSQTERDLRRLLYPPPHPG